MQAQSNFHTLLLNLLENLEKNFVAKRLKWGFSKIDFDPTPYLDPLLGIRPCAPMHRQKISYGNSKSYLSWKIDESVKLVLEFGVVSWGNYKKEHEGYAS